MEGKVDASPAAVGQNIPVVRLKWRKRVIGEVLVVLRPSHNSGSQTSLFVIEFPYREE